MTSAVVELLHAAYTGVYITHAADPVYSLLIIDRCPVTFDLDRAACSS